MVAANRPEREYVKLGGDPNLKIEELYAFVAVGPEGEGIMGGFIEIDGKPVMLPFVAADLARVKALIPKANEVAKASGFQYKIFRFRGKEDVTDELKGNL